MGDGGRANYGEIFAFVDARDGTLRKLRGPEAETAGDTFLAGHFPLHSGHAFGLAGQILIAVTGLVVAGLVVAGLVVAGLVVAGLVVAGLVVAGLSVTGWLLWWRKRRPNLAA